MARYPDLLLYGFGPTHHSRAHSPTEEQLFHSTKGQSRETRLNSRGGSGAGAGVGDRAWGSWLVDVSVAFLTLTSSTGNSPFCESVSPVPRIQQEHNKRTLNRCACAVLPREGLPEPCRQRAHNSQHPPPSGPRWCCEGPGRNELPPPLRSLHPSPAQRGPPSVAGCISLALLSGAGLGSAVRLVPSPQVTVAEWGSSNKGVRVFAEAAPP